MRSLRSIVGYRPPQRRRTRKLLTSPSTSVVTKKEQGRRQSHLSTWTRFHAEVNGADLALLPLTPTALEKVATHMKDLGYKSINNFLSSLRKHHIKSGHSWSDSLIICYRELRLLARRNVGPPRRRRSFDIAKLITCYQFGIGVTTQLCGAHTLVSLSTQCMFRSAEVGAVNCSDVILQPEGNILTMKVSSSKTDVEARGMKFRWHCICASDKASFFKGQAQTWMRCPYHTAAHYATTHHQFDLKRPVGGDWPFFKTKSGRRVTSEQIGKYLADLHCRFAIASDESESLSTNFGGHSLRRSGAQMWFLSGLPEQTIRSLARWRSAIIEAYLGQAPVSNLGSWSFQNVYATGSEMAGHLVIDRALHDMRRASKFHFDDFKKEIKMEAAMALKRKREHEAPPMQSESEDPPVPSGTRVVTRAPAKIWNIHKIQNMTGSVTEWRTVCNFKFGLSPLVALLSHSYAASQKAEPCNKGCFNQ